MTVPNILQLTNKKSFIDLRDFDNQNTSLNTIRKRGNEMNEITVFGTDDNYDNFINNLKDHDEIKIAHNGTKNIFAYAKKMMNAQTAKKELMASFQQDIIYRVIPEKMSK